MCDTACCSPRLRAIGIFLAFLLAVPGMSLLAGGQAEIEVDEIDPDALEAPQLASLVEAGELPPLEERLPANPVVIEPHEEPGRYGGTANSALIGAADAAWLQRTVGYEGMVRWNPEWTEVKPNYAEAVDASDDATEFTFHLREGLRWSDGEPVTTDDVAFWVEDFAYNAELSPVTPEILMGEDERAELTVIDDYTFTLSFDSPQGMFLEFAAENQHFLMPRHYLEQFHADYNPDADQNAQNAGYDDWMDKFDFMSSATSWDNPDLPVLYPWVVREPYTGEYTRVTFERNPYYFKVDSEGRQLPYIDEWAFDLLEDDEVLLLRTLAGDIDLMARHANTAANRPVFYENQEAGNFRMLDLQSAAPTDHAIYLNQNSEDWGELFRNRDFRAGLSHAIDREEIIDIMYGPELSRPWGAAPQEETPFYSERLATEHVAYDVEAANEYLDAAGLEERDRAGYRLTPEGERVIVTVSVQSGASEAIDVLEIIQPHWEEVGIDLAIDSVDRALLTERRQNNQHDAIIRGGTGGFDAISAPRMYLPVAFDWAPRWNRWWYNRGGYITHAVDDAVSEEEPPEILREMLEIHARVLSEPDAQARNEMMREMFELTAEFFPTIGTVSTPPGYGIAHNRLRNVPSSQPSSWRIRSPANNHTEQFWIDE